MNRRNPVLSLLLFFVVFSAWSSQPAVCQTEEAEQQKIAEFSAEATLTSKFLWRGLRLTDGWCFQPSATVAAKGLSLNVWGNMDLQSLNEGDHRLLKENPLATGCPSGLRGLMSEIDITASYSGDLSSIGFDLGMIAYILPYTSESNPSTTELFGSLSFPEVPLAPRVALYADVDETRKYAGTGVYLELTAEHSFGLTGTRLESIDLSARMGAINGGYAGYWHEDGLGAGLHDVGVGARFPIRLGQGWTSTVSAGYSRLIGKYRDYQCVNLRDWYLGTAHPPSEYSDTLWGGITFSFDR